MNCDLCKKREAFYRRIHEGIALCSICFKNNIEKKVKSTISKYKMFEPNDHIALALSGGKDSLTLLMILNKLEKRFPHSKLTAITIDEGIKGYRDEAIELAKEYCSSMNIDHFIISFKELFGFELDEIVKIGGDLSPCAYCGVLRRRAIDKAAKIVKSTKIATAHNLDDEAQTILLNLFNGDIAKMARIDPVLKDPNGKFLVRVKPLCEIMEKEIALYAYLKGIKFQSIPCPYVTTSLRNDIRNMLNRLDEKHPGIKYIVYRSAQKIKDSLKTTLKKFELKTCMICGEVTTNEVCKVCTMIKEISK
ncbi:MAG: TIGR00269 family protein [Candidatus Bathyarchaeia archaeon]